MADNKKNQKIIDSYDSGKRRFYTGLYRSDSRSSDK